MNTLSVPEAIVQEIKAIEQAHAAYVVLKTTALNNIAKLTLGKSNIGPDNLENCKKWLGFSLENPDCFNQRFNQSDFGFKMERSPVLTSIEKLESDDRVATKLVHDIVYSDLRSYWSDAETVYDNESKGDKELREKYKGLPKIGGVRMTQSEEDKTFERLETKRNKKNGGQPPKTT
jgi:hypothetical protein